MLLETPGNGSVGSIARTRTRVDDDIDRGQRVLVLPKRLTDETFDAIATHRDTDDFRGDGQTQPRSRSARVTNENGKQRVGETARIAIDAIELGFVPEALRRCERPRSCVQTKRTRAKCFRR